MTAWVDPALRRRIDLFESSLAVDRFGGVYDLLGDAGFGGHHLEGGARRRPLLCAVIEHGFGRIAHHLFHVAPVLDAVAVISRITHHGQHIAVMRIRDHHGAAEGIQVQLTGRQITVLDQFAHIIEGRPVLSVLNGAEGRVRRLEQPLVKEDQADQVSVCGARLHHVLAHDAPEAVVGAGLFQDIPDQCFKHLIGIIGIGVDLIFFDPSRLGGAIEEIPHGSGP